MHLGPHLGWDVGDKEAVLDVRLCEALLEGFPYRIYVIDSGRSFGRWNT